MREKGTSVSIAALALASVSGASAADVELEPAVQAVTSWRFGDSREPLTALAALVKASKSAPPKLLALERQFASLLLSPDATYECKDFICRQLWIIGTKVSVPALAPMLADDTYSDMARYALERNHAPEAGKALRDALTQASGKPLVGVINSLGERRDRMSVLALEKIVAGPDDDAAAAAASALGKIGGAKATTVLSRAKQVGAPKVRDAATLALAVMSGRPEPRIRK